VLRLSITNRAQLLLLAAIICANILIFVAANGPRGTDQYWYLANTETLSHDQIYPKAVFEQESGAPATNYFKHNGPALHLTGSLAKWISPYSAWMVVNYLSHFIVAIAIFLIAAKYTNRHYAAVSTALYLVSPIAIWQTINVLQEQFFAAIMAIALLCFAYRTKRSASVILHCTLLLGVVTHPIFFYLAVACYFLTVFHSLLEQSLPQTVLPITLLLPVIFPNSFQPDLLAIISGSVPHKSNMLWHYSSQVDPVSIPLLIEKARYAFLNHIWPIRNTVLYAYTNLALLLIVPLIIFREAKHQSILPACMLALGLYVAIIFLMQLQPRYQQIVSSATFTILAIGVYTWGRRFSRLVGVAVIAVFAATVTISATMVNTVRQQAVAAQHAIQTLTVKFNEHIPQNTSVAVIDSDHELKLGYALRPRPTLTLKSEFLSDTMKEKAITLFEPAFYISTNASLAEKGRISLISKAEIEGFDDFYLYRAGQPSRQDKL